MKKVGFYAGSFDPFTVGHFRILCEALCSYDKVIVAIGENPAKKPLFDVETRKELILKTISNFIVFWQSKDYTGDNYSAAENIALHRMLTESECVEVISYDYLTVDAAIAHGATSLIRGKRIIGDDADEMNQAMINKQLLAVRNCHLSTDLIPVPQESLTYISSSTFKKLCALGEYITAQAYVSLSVHKAAMKEYLEKDFLQACSMFLTDAFDVKAYDLYDKLCKAYEERTYHSLTHLAYGINWFNIYCRHKGLPDGISREEFLLAWFYHDFVMDGDAPEEDSIKVFQEHFGTDNKTVPRLIRATKHTGDEFRNTFAEQLINDIDMLILGDKANYGHYCLALKSEVPVEMYGMFEPMRIAFLEKYRKGKIFELQFFEKKFGHIARENMRRELNYLRSL